MSENSQNTVFIGLALICALALAVVLWAWGLPLTNDGPTYVLQAWVWNHYGEAAYDYARYYELTRAVTASGFVDIQRALEPLLGWKTAWRVNVILCAELWAGSFLAFVVAFDRRRRMAGLLGFGLAIQMPLFFGFMPFFLGTALGWVTLATWLRVQNSVLRHAVAFILVSVAAYCHIVAAALTGLMLGVFVIAREPRRRWVGALAALLPVGSVALLIAWQASKVKLTATGETEWAALTDRLLFGGVWFQTGPLWRSLGITALGLAGLTAVVVAARRQAATHLEQAIAVVAVLAIVISALLPFDLSGWQFAGTRALPLGVSLAVALVPVHDLRRGVRLAARAGVLAYVSASLLWAGAALAKLRRASSDALAVLDVPPSPAARVGINLLDVTGDFPLPRFEPLFNVGNLYAVVLGGMEGYGHHDGEGIHQLRVRDTERVPTPNPNLWGALAVLPQEARAGALRGLLGRIAPADGIVMAAERADHEVAKAAGFVAEHESDTLLIARFEGCDGQIVLEGAWLEAARQSEAAAEPLDVAVGWWPSRTPTLELSYSPAPDAPRTMALERAGCGEVWLTVSSPTGARCAGVEPGMPVRAVFARGAANVLACRVETPRTP